MKNILFMLIALFAISCTNTGVNVTFDDEKSNAIREHYQNYLNNDVAALQSLWSPDLKIYMNSIEASGARRYVGILAKLSTDTGSNYTTLSESYDSMHDQSGNTTFGAGGSTIIVDVTNETTFRLKWTTSCSGSASFDGNTNQQRTGFTCIKLGDT